MLNRRLFLSAAGCSVASVPGFLAANTAEAKFSLPPRAQWSEKQEQGRREAERHFRRRRIPWKYRDQVFEGLVYAVKKGKREAQEIVDEAGRYLTAAFPEVPEWLKWLATLLSIMSALLTILLLFI